MGIRGKMILLVGCTVVASSVLSLLGLYRFWNLSRERMEDALLKRAETAALAYDQWTESAKRQTQLLASTVPVTKQGEVSLEQNYLNSVLKESNYLEGVYVVDGSGVIIGKGLDDDLPRPETIQRLFEAHRAGTSEMTAVYESNERTNSKLYFAARAPDGGVLIVTRISTDRLGEVFNDLRLSEGSVVTVIDPEGNVLYRRSDTQSSFDPGITRKGLVDAIANKPYAVKDVVSPHDGIKRVSAVVRAEDGNVLVALGLASDQYFAPLWSGLYQRIALAALIFLVFGAVAFVVAISIVGPIRNLQKATNAFALGDRDARADARADGELGDLAGAFNRMAKQINAREDKLKEADKMRTEYVSSVSHELKTPLTTIKTLTHVLDSGGPSEAERHEYLRMIDAECDRQIGFVSDLLDVAVIEDGRTEVELASVDVSSALKEAINSEIPAAITKDLQLVFDPANRLPAIKSNLNSLVKIFRILIENAINYSPAGSKVRAAARLYECEIGVSISDYGRGIDDRDMPFIFNKFYRGRQRVDAESNERTNGVGLGLFLAKGLASQIGGRIEAENRPTGGATFTVFLPIENGSNHGSSIITG